MRQRTEKRKKLGEIAPQQNTKNGVVVFSSGEPKEKKGGMPVSIFRARSVSPLFSRKSGRYKDQFTKPFRNVEIRRRCSRGLPGGIKARFGGSFDAVKIQPPSGRRIEALDEIFHGQRNLRDPGFSGFVQNNAAPQSTLQVVFLAWPDVQIDPKAIRADFEFFITAEMRRVGLKKSFHDVAVPELVAAAVGFGIRKNGDDTVFGAESQIERFRGPEQPHFRFSFGISVLALPVSAETQRRRQLPGRQSWKSIGIGQVRHSNSHSSPLSGHSLVSKHPYESLRAFPGTPTWG